MPSLEKEVIVLVFRLLANSDSFIVSSMASTIERYHRYTLASNESSELTVDQVQVVIR